MNKSSSISSEICSQSFQLRVNTEKKMLAERYQRSHHEKWKKKDKKYIDKYLIIHSYIDMNYSKFQMAEFTVHGDYDPTCYIKTPWQALPAVSTPAPFELSGYIIKPRVSIRLRSLACDIKIKSKFKGDSHLYIVTRTQGEIESFSPFIKISKDTNLNGIFLLFGTLNPNTFKATLMKQVQVPESRQVLESQNKSSKLQITITDNGDSRIQIKISNYGKKETIKDFHSYCDSFLPFFDKSVVLIGGSGESIKLLGLEIQQRERVIQSSRIRENDCKCLVI